MKIEFNFSYPVVEVLTQRFENKLNLNNFTGMFRTIVMLSIVSSSIAFAPLSIAKHAARSLTTMSLKKGDTIPNVTFKARVRDDSIGGSNPFDWKDVSTDDLFKNKRAVVFALPGG